MNLKEQMLAVDPDIVKAGIEGWPDDLYIRQIKADEMDKHRAILHEDENGSWVIRAAYWIALTACTKEGAHVFVRDNKGMIFQKDIDRLMDMPMYLVRNLSDRILECNKLLGSSLEDSVKNSEET